MSTTDSGPAAQAVSIPVLQDVAHAEARRALASGAPVFLPVNPVEYHGPHLSLHNDALVTQGLIRDLHARWQGGPLGGPLLVAADLEVGVDPTPGPGSRPVPAAQVARLVRGACLGLAALGARRVVIATFHGSPMHNLALEAGRRALAERGIPVVCPMNALFASVIGGGDARDRERLARAAEAISPEVRQALETDSRFDFHAGLMETSLALHYAPQSVSPSFRELPPCPPVTPVGPLNAAARVTEGLGRTGLATELRFAALGLGWLRQRPFSGYSGQPHLASTALGRALAGVAVDHLQEVVEAVFLGGRASPKPILGWLWPLTLGGHLGGTGASRGP